MDGWMGNGGAGVGFHSSLLLFRLVRMAYTRQKARIPEPMHRTEPPPVHSLLSHRRPIRPSIVGLRRICQFYEAKGGGTYSRETPAARYLFQLSREVQEHLDFLEEEDDRKNRRLNYLEKVAREWNAAFGPDALDKADLDLVVDVGGRPLTPRILMRRLKDLTEKCGEWKIVVQELHRRNEENLANFQKAVDEQHQRGRDAYRDEIARLRRVHEAEMQRERAIYEEELRELQETTTARRSSQHDDSSEREGELDSLRSENANLRERVGNLCALVVSLEEERQRHDLATAQHDISRLRCHWDTRIP